MKFIRPLPVAEDVFNRYALTENEKKKRKEYIANIQDILRGKKQRNY